VAFGDGEHDEALRTAWYEFCDRLKAAGDFAFKDTDPANPAQRADAFRYLTQNLGQAYDLALEIVELDPRRRQSLPLAIAGDLAARNGEDREALELCIAAAKIMQWQNVRWGLGAILMRIGTILVACDPEAAAVLDGAGEALAPGFVHAPHTIEARERAVAMSTDALGEARRAELFHLGHAMTDIEAVAYAAAVVNRFLSEQ